MHKMAAGTSGCRWLSAGASGIQVVQPGVVGREPLEAQSVQSQPGRQIVVLNTARIALVKHFVKPRLRYPEDAVCGGKFFAECFVGSSAGLPGRAVEKTRVSPLATIGATPRHENLNCGRFVHSPWRTDIPKLLLVMLPWFCVLQARSHLRQIRHLTLAHGNSTDTLPKDSLILSGACPKLFIHR